MKGHRSIISRREHARARAGPKEIAACPILLKALRVVNVPGIHVLQVEAERLQESEKANAAHNEKHGARQQIRRIDKELKALQVRTAGLMAQWLRDRFRCLSSSLSRLGTCAKAE